MKGTVKWFNTSKGFGFIAPEDGGNDISVRIIDLDGLRIDEGDVLQFDLQESITGHEAINIMMLEKNPRPPTRQSFNGGANDNHDQF